MLRPSLRRNPTTPQTQPASQWPLAAFHWGAGTPSDDKFLQKISLTRILLAVEKLTCHSPVLGGPGNCVHLDGVTELFSHHEADRGTEMIVRVNPVPANWRVSHLLTWWGTSPGREAQTSSLLSCTSRRQSAQHSQGSPWLCRWPSWRCSPQSWLFPHLPQSWRRMTAPPWAAEASPPPLVPPSPVWSEPGPWWGGRGWGMFSCWLAVVFCCSALVLLQLRYRNR